MGRPVQHPPGSTPTTPEREKRAKIINAEGESLAVGAVAVVLAATALVAAAWQGYAKLPPGHAAPG